MPTKTPDKNRMTLELLPKARAQLERLSEATDQSLSEVIRRAIGLYALVGSELQAGATMKIHRKHRDSIEVMLPEFFE